MSPERRTARAPGRVNLIGDHTDYTGGFCLPIAVDRWVEVEVQPDRSSHTVVLCSEDQPGAVTIPTDINDLDDVTPPWGRYVAAVVKRLALSHGAAGTIRSDVPIGAGLSSSAALEVATALALAPDHLDPLALAMLCRDAEHEARGVPTGLLDQLASILGIAGHALLLDCSTNTITPVPLPETARFVVVREGDRELATTGYAERVAQCRRAEQEIGPLRTASLADTESIADPMLRRRARHVVTENERVHAFADAISSDQLELAGEIMNSSHHSLRVDFESSTPRIDQLCDDLRDQPGVLGARITGGGWGGCVVALTRPGAMAGRGWPVRAVAGASVTADSG